MPKPELVHLRFIDFVACDTAKGFIQYRVWTRDPNDVTCNNCMRTNFYKTAKKRLSST